jgi:thiol-disulfide isomerase/thioredoxin
MEDSENQDIPAQQTTFIPEEPVSRKRIFLPIVVILALIVGTLMYIKASVQKESRLEHQTIQLSEGADIPNLELTKLDGSKVKLSDLPHKVMMINFWATWCEACIEEMPSLVKLREAYNSKGFEVLGINVDSNSVKVAPPAMQKFGIKFPVFMDKNEELAEIFDVHAIPLNVIINQDRKILLIEGSRDWDTEEVHQMLDNWLK